jgi:hypothetical protein
VCFAQGVFGQQAFDQADGLGEFSIGHARGRDGAR